MYSLPRDLAHNSTKIFRSSYLRAECCYSFKFQTFSKHNSKESQCWSGPEKISSSPATHLLFESPLQYSQQVVIRQLLDLSRARLTTISQAFIPTSCIVQDMCPYIFLYFHFSTVPISIYLFLILYQKFFSWFLLLAGSASMISYKKGICSAFYKIAFQMSEASHHAILVPPLL